LHYSVCRITQQKSQEYGGTIYTPSIWPLFRNWTLLSSSGLSTCGNNTL